MCECVFSIKKKLRESEREKFDDNINDGVLFVHFSIIIADVAIVVVVIVVIELSISIYLFYASNAIFIFRLFFASCSLSRSSCIYLMAIYSFFVF